MWSHPSVPTPNCVTRCNSHLVNRDGDFKLLHAVDHGAQEHGEGVDDQRQEEEQQAEGKHLIWRIKTLVNCQVGAKRSKSVVSLTLTAYLKSSPGGDALPVFRQPVVLHRGGVTILSCFPEIASCGRDPKGTDCNCSDNVILIRHSKYTVAHSCA